MQFKPIIHNLQPCDKGYAEAQLYNNLIANKPKGDMLLAKKVHLQRAWERLCSEALDNVKKALGE